MIFIFKQYPNGFNFASLITEGNATFIKIKEMNSKKSLIYQLNSLIK